MEVIGPIQGGKGAEIVPPSLEQAREFARQSKAENTLRGYRADWRNFCAWCEARNVGALPSIPETVASYIAECAGHLKSSVFSGGGTPLPKRNKVARLDSPKHTAIVRNTMKGYPADSRNRAGSKSANADGRSPRLGGRRRRGASSARATVR